ncbi:sulfate adenylyltransferase subunit CysN [Acidicapsa ligni]|uniref:sulfate adenylyltransferase subunit CysN n=1 Tax=Acidicapsa ligni TaxID=542300 RepID=UPI0021E001BB|nr:sulfate adenylyltransferase subunit CysN [Acidicapsa ligni]
MTLAAPSFVIDQFLTQEREKDLLRFSTAGSVDDGKSTLIGRLLYDTQSVYEDQVRSIEGKGTTAPGQIDFALLTDGLRAEREQGITIDVAYRYFSTARRKFIIADTPGHEQYTRNMATGASTADATVVLLDASKGVLMQSRRHAYIASLLRVKHVVVAVNKMDLIGYSETSFRTIERDFQLVLDQIASDTGNPVEATFIPVSALAGDNIVHRSTAMSWYGGPSLLEVLEALPSSLDTRYAPFRFPVQRVIRPDHTFRGFAGQIASGTIRPGDTITALPSGRVAKISRIVTWDGDLSEAHAPLSVTLTLDRELDISRGDLIASSQAPASIVKTFPASLVWMDQRPLALHRRYLLKHSSHSVPAVVSTLEYRTNVGTLTHEPAATLEMNGIGTVTIQVLRPIAIDSYGEDRSTGAFILIDPETNGTVAAGMVTDLSRSISTNEEPAISDGPVTSQERAQRWGHRGALIEFSGPEEILDKIERSLFARGAVTSRIHSALLETRSEQSAAIIDFNIQSGFLVLVTSLHEARTVVVRAEGQEIVINTDDESKVVSAVYALLSRVHIINASGKADVE